MEKGDNKLKAKSAFDRGYKSEISGSTPEYFREDTMNKFIALITDSGLIKMADIVSELEENGCVLTAVHKSIGIISGRSPLNIQELNELKIPGVEEVSADQPLWAAMTPPDSEVQ